MCRPDIVNRNRLGMVTVRFNPLDCCVYKFKYAVFPFYEFAITSASPYLLGKVGH